MAPPLRVAPLLFFSGCCALVYQIAWLRVFAKTEPLRFSMRLGPDEP
ncbi:MAG TPA: hypothetical protein VKA01_09395 [Vicinamibacteria bacterium]|nr:hypothetical protein [Vicinamibacteria bacterium]